MAKENKQFEVGSDVIQNGYTHYATGYSIPKGTTTVNDVPAEIVTELLEAGAILQNKKKQTEDETKK